METTFCSGGFDNPTMVETFEVGDMVYAQMNQMAGDIECDVSHFEKAFYYVNRETNYYSKKHGLRGKFYKYKDEPLVDYFDMGD